MPKTTQQRTPLVIALTTALALLLVWPTWVAMRNGLSDLYARPAIDFLAGKRFDSYTISEVEWRAIDNIVTQADKLMPGNPRYLEALGLLQQLKLTVFGDELSVEERSAHASAAKDYFLKSLERRPTWPYYWGNLALEHYRGGNYGADEYSLALANASRFGPWKNDIQRLVVDLGSKTLEFLSPRAKREILLSVERGLHRQPENTIRLVLGNGAWPKLCEASDALLDITLPRIEAVCANERFAE